MRFWGVVWIRNFHIDNGKFKIFLSEYDLRCLTPKKKGGIEHIKYPLLSDVTHEIANIYECIPENSPSLRATYIIDEKGILRHFSKTDFGVGRSVEEVFFAIKF